jgi:hypothetical protein
MKKLLRKWLGIDDTITYLDSLSITVSQQHANTRDAIAIHNRALGRLIARIDPMFFAEDNLLSSDEYKKRRAESDELGDKAIARIIAEHKAQKPYG